MSTKKEKCGLCKHETPCPHSRIDNMMGKAFQRESIEWEKNLDYNSTDFGEMGKFIRVEYAKNILEKAITTAVSNREKEIAEEVEKKSFRGFAPYEQDYLIKKEDVLSILKH